MSLRYNPGSLRVKNFGSLKCDKYGYSVRRMRYGERLKMARQHAGLTQAQLADRIGNLCSQENISKLERGEATGSEFTAQFADACHVSALWLASERGEMVWLHASELVTKIARRLQTMTESEQYLVERMLDAVMTTSDSDEHLGSEIHGGNR
jgi:transcriptional regulator with XRE-family HTH domain